MKKIFIIFITACLSVLPAFSIEEVILDAQSNKFDYISDVYYGKIEDNNNVSPVLRLFTKDGLVFDNSYINSVKLSFLYGGNLSFDKIHNKSLNTLYDVTSVEPSIKIKFNENKSQFFFDYNFMRDYEGYSHKFAHRISQLNVSHKINENQSIIIGQGKRLPTIVNGSLSTMTQEMVLKSQIGRTLGNSRSVGIRNIGDYKYVDYDIGIYDSTRYMQDFGRGLDFSGHIMFKPLANIEDKAGSLKIGSGYNIGDYYGSYQLFSVYTGYDYKKFHIKGEYANANGYNSVQFSKNDAEGFYGTVEYDIHPKLQLIGRYDYFIPNKLFSCDNSQEYTVGITYKPFENMKIMLNYVKREMSENADSNMILFATRFFI